MTDHILPFLKRMNNYVAIVAGALLLACALFISLDVVLRKFGIPLGSSEEIAGYVMASLSSWGASYGLTSMAHVRIDMLRNKMQSYSRAFFDLIAIGATSFVALFLANSSLPVLQKSLKSGALANTALETPLYIPQTIWLAGWHWFAISSSVLTLYSAFLLYKKRYQDIEESIGTGQSV